MIALHPNILEKDGKKEFVVLPFEDFKRIEEELSKYEDLIDLRNAKAKEKHVDSYSLNDAKKILNIM